MRGTLFTLILFTFCSAYTNAQVLKESDLTNAYQISKQLIKINKQIKEPSYIPTENDKSDIKLLISTLGWYANLKDINSEEIRDSLFAKFSRRYKNYQIYIFL
jgi:hypothetical protein